MVLKGRNFFYHNKSGLALKPQSVSNTTVNGETILKPWLWGNQITFLLLGGAFASSSVGACPVQVRQISDGSWVPMTQKDGTTALVFTAAKLADAGALENGIVLGTIPFDEIDTETYDAIRINYTESATAAQLVAAAYVISDIFNFPSPDGDNLEDLFTKVAVPAA